MSNEEIIKAMMRWDASSTEPALPEPRLLATELCGHVLEAYGYTVEDLRAYGEAVRAEQRERLETAEKLLAWLEADGGTRVFKLGVTWYARQAYGQPHRKARNMRAAIDAAIRAGGG